MPVVPPMPTARQQRGGGKRSCLTELAQREPDVAAGGSERREATCLAR